VQYFKWAYVFSSTERKPVAYFNTVFLSNLVFGTKYLTVPTCFSFLFSYTKTGRFLFYKMLYTRNLYLLALLTTRTEERATCYWLGHPITGHQGPRRGVEV
jgi:hypothetical protein